MYKKVTIFLLSFVVIYLFNFYIPRLMPGDPFSHSSTVSGEEMGGLSEEDLQRLKSYYGLDKPLKEQLIDTIKMNLRGDFGQSILYKKSVTEVILKRLPWTLYIMFSTLLISLLLGLFLAQLCIKNTKIDLIIYKIMSMISEIPPFLIGILFLFLIAAKIKWFPLAGNITPFKKYDSQMEFLFDVFRHSILPVTALVIVNIPIFYFTARSSIKTILDKQYILNAKAKGLSEKRIKYKYILLNAVFPIIARFFLSVGSCIGGAMLIENVFAYPGLGKILRDAVMYRDYILIQGVFLLSTTTVLLSSFISDIINSFIGGSKA